MQHFTGAKPVFITDISYHTKHNKHHQSLKNVLTVNWATGDIDLSGYIGIFHFIELVLLRVLMLSNI